MLDCPSSSKHVWFSGQVSFIFATLQRHSQQNKKMDKVAMLEGKLKQLADSSILLLFTFFIYILVPAKIFSLVSQKGDFNINNIMNKKYDTLCK